MTEYKQCNHCVLDTNDDENITFDDAGVCNYCISYAELDVSRGTQAERTRWLENKVDEIHERGKGHRFNCIAGLSGGVDSSYLALWAKKHDLRPLVVHLDNSWNSELAVKNIETICERLDYELYTHVIDWEEFKSLQLAFLRASVVDIEVLTDHAISAVINRLAKKYNIKYTLSGFNFATEAIMPKGWTFNKGDWENIKDISAKNGGIRHVKTYPHTTFLQKLFLKYFHRIESVMVLNYMEYDKHDAINVLKRELDWREYGVKHGESIFTKFYQQYILPVKFGIDKRKAHLSNLICSGMISREEALEELEKDICDPHEIQEDKEYVLKKFGLSEKEFDDIMRSPVKKHTEYKTEQRYWDAYFKLIKVVKMK